jgi:hypothetical protein
MSNNEKVTPETPLGDQDKILTLAAVLQGNKVVEGSSPAPSKLTAETLFVADATNTDDQTILDITNNNSLINLLFKGAKVEKINSWEELYSLLIKYSKIDRLVLYFHGTPGSLIIAHVNKSLDKAAQELKGKNLPEITRQLDLEGCEVAQDAGKIIPFARLFKAPRATAWNLFDVIKPLKLTIIPNETVQDLENNVKYKSYKYYFVKGTPSSTDLVKRPGEYTIIAEWFRRDPDREQEPPSDPSQDRSNFVRRSDAKEKVITPEQASKLTYPPVIDRTVPLEHIIINMR